MGSENHLLMGFSSSPSWQHEELRQTFREGIGDAIGEVADNLQFSRHLFALPAAYDRELEGIETELRSLVQRIHGLVIAIEQAGEPGLCAPVQPEKATVTAFPNAWQGGGSAHQAA
jgi:hypothetical protein